MLWQRTLHSSLVDLQCLLKEILTGGGQNFWLTEDRSPSDRARPKAVPGVCAGGGVPFRKGSGSITPGKISTFLMPVRVF